MITGDTLQMPSTFSQQLYWTICSNLSMLCYVFAFSFMQSSIIILLISNWFLHLYDPFQCTFCLHGSNYFCSGNEYMLSVMIEVNSLYGVYKHVISLYFFRQFISLVFCSRYVMPFTSHSEICSGFFIVFNNEWVSTLCVERF